MTIRPESDPTIAKSEGWKRMRGEGAYVHKGLPLVPPVSRKEARERMEPKTSVAMIVDSFPV